MKDDDWAGIAPFLPIAWYGTTNGVMWFFDLDDFARTGIIVGIAFIVLFVIVGIMVGPNYDGMNAPALGDTKDTNQN